MTKRNIRIVLLIWEIVAICLIYFALIMMFEVVIKKLLINASIHTIYETVESAQAEYRNAVDFLESKPDLPYAAGVGEIGKYLKDFCLTKFKYPDSMVLVLSHDQGFADNTATNRGGGFVFPKGQAEYRRFYLEATGLPQRIGNNEYQVLAKKLAENDRSFLLDFYHPDDVGHGYSLAGFPDKIKAERLFQIIVGTPRQNLPDPNEMSKDRYVDFYLNGISYIGVAALLDPALGKNLDRAAQEKFNPVIIVGDSQSDFFSAINNVRNIFLAILGGIIFIIFAIKVYNTFVITREIKSISDTIKEESIAIETKGEIGTSLKKMNLSFNETTTLYGSYESLSVKLADVGEIISGIADKDLFVATLRNDKSILDPHEVNMSILFLDVRGFTTISEKYKEKAMGIINEIWSAVETIVYPNRGKINKYMGDAALIIFPEILENGRDFSTRNALASGVAILEKVPDLRAKLNIEFNFRVGIDYGRLVYGKTGSHRNYELGVIGDPVNTASRFEALNKKYNTNLLVATEALRNAGYDPTEAYILGDDKRAGKYSFYLLDRARPAGKKESKDIYTIRIEEKDGFRFLGSDNIFPAGTFKEFSGCLEEFLLSIKCWQSGDPDTGEKCWTDLAKRFALFSRRTHFPPAEIFLSKILKYEEMLTYEADPEAWLHKAKVAVKVPDPDWVKYGTIELAK